MRYQTKPADNLSQTVSHFRYKDLHQCRLEREQSPKMRMLSKGKPRSCSVAKERRVFMTCSWLQEKTHAFRYITATSISLLLRNFAFYMLLNAWSWSQLIAYKIKCFRMHCGSKHFNSLKSFDLHGWLCVCVCLYMFIQESFHGITFKP